MISTVFVVGLVAGTIVITGGLLALALHWAGEHPADALLIVGIVSLIILGLTY